MNAVIKLVRALALVGLLAIATLSLALLSGCGSSSSNRSNAATRTCALRSGCGGSSSSRSNAATRTCTDGYGFGPGIGWQVRANSFLSCRSAVALMRAYFAHDHHGAIPTAPKTVEGYACNGLFDFGGQARIGCAHGRASAIAVAARP